MKIVLTDINLRNKKLKIEKEKIFDIHFVYLYLNKKTIRKISRKMYGKLLKIYLKKVVLKDEKSIFILSKETKSFSLDKYFDFGFNEFITKNTIRENSINYLDNYSHNTSLLIITNEIDKNVLSRYVEKFKEINIYTDNVSKLINTIKKVEKEYGAVINIYDKYSNIYLNVDIAVYLDDIHIEGKVKAKKNFFLTENTLDKYSKEYQLFTEYREKIKQSQNYPERKLALAISYLHNFNLKS